MQCFSCHFYGTLNWNLWGMSWKFYCLAFEAGTVLCDNVKLLSLNLYYVMNYSITFLQFSELNKDLWPQQEQATTIFFILIQTKCSLSCQQILFCILKFWQTLYTTPYVTANSLYSNTIYVDFLETWNASFDTISYNRKLHFYVYTNKSYFKGLKHLFKQLRCIYTLNSHNKCTDKQSELGNCNTMNISIRSKWQ